MAGLIDAEAGESQSNKRMTGDAQVRDAEVAEAPTCKKARTEPTLESESGAIQAAPLEPEMLPALALEKALDVASKTSGIHFDVSKTRLEVCWEVADDEAEDPKPITLWWGCTVAELVSEHPRHGPVWLLKYDEKDVDTKTFDAEERTVVFCTSDLLIDLDAASEGGGGGSKGLMQWRLEGASTEPAPILPVGQPVKARFRGGEAWFAGSVKDLHTDGTYDITYEDGDEETAVARELIEPVEVEDDDEADTLDETIVAHDIDSFFEIFTQIMTSGPAFTALPPEKQRIAADRIADMRPFLREELERLREEQGHGYTVTGDDIQVHPKPM